MPFLDGSTPETTVRIDGTDPHAYVPPELTWTPDVADVTSSFFNYENTVGSVARTMGDRWSLYYARQSGWDAIDDDYDVFGDPDVLSFVTERPELATAFAPAQSMFEAGLIRRRILEEDEARETMAAAGAGGVAAMLATGLLDPVNLLPIGSAVRSLNLGRIAQGAAEGAAAGFVSGVAAEGILQSTQYTRTTEESLINVAASTLLSGVLGGGISLLSPAKRSALEDGFAAAARDAKAAFDGVDGLAPQGGGGSGGAAATRATTMADETRVPTGVGAERAGELPIVGNPMGRLSSSPSLEVRRLARDLSETAYHFEGEARGQAAPQAVETRIKAHEGPLAEALSAIDDAFVRHRFGQKVFAGKMRAGVQDLTGRRGGDKLTREQFMQRVGYAARRDDVDETIPEVAEAAKHARRIMDDLKDRAIESDILSPDVHPKTARSYLTRVWNREKIKARRPKLQEIAYEWLGGLREAAKARGDQVDAWSKAAKAAAEKVERLEEALKRQADLDIPGLRAKGRAAQKLAGELRRELAVRERRVETLKRRLATAQQRQVRPSDRLPTIDEILRGDTASPEVKVPDQVPRDGGSIAQPQGTPRDLGGLIEQAKADRTEAAFNRQFGDEAKPAAATPAPRNGMVRMYHGGAPGGTNGPLWVTSSLEDAKGWASRSSDMQVWYVDVPEERLVSGYGVKTIKEAQEQGFAPLSRIEIPADIANKRQVFREGLRPGVASAEAKKPAAPVDPVLKQFVLDIHDARTLKEPQRIIERIRDMGGVRDLGGELAARGFKPIKKRNGKPIKSKDWQREIIDDAATSADARGLDQVAREMQEAGEGFLPLRQAGDEDTDALVAALESDANGSPVYAEYGPGASEVARYQDAQAFKAELDRQGIDISWSNERIAAELGLIDNYVPDTPGVRARQREAGFYERRVADDLKAEEKAKLEAEQKMIAAEADAKDKLDIAQRLRGGTDTIKRDRAAAKRARDKFEKLVESERELQIMTDADLRDVSRQIVDKLLGHETAGAMDLDASRNLRGAILERSFTIPDAKIEEFLENDIEQVLRVYTRQMGADVELAKAFGRPDMMDQFDEIKQAYQKVRDGVPALAKVQKGYDEEKALVALDKRMADDIADLALIRDRLRGTAGLPKDPDQMLVRGFRVVRGLNYLRLMGGATAASFADTGAVVMTHGMKRVFGRQGLKAMGEAIKAMRGKKGAADEVRRAGTALDLVLDSRALNLAEIGDDYGKQTKFERGLRYAQNKYGVANALSVWTSFWKQFAGVIGQTRILEEVERVAAGTASKAEVEHLAYLGIDFDMATRLNLMQKKNGTIEKALRTANTERWDDREAVTAIRAALAKEVDTTVVTPGAGDKPAWMSEEWGKTVGQFKSFSLSAMSRTTARGLQQRDVAAMQGMIMMITMGMLSYYVKTRDEDIDWDNPVVWIKEGVDRSGITGWVFEALNTQEKILGGLGINAAIGSPSARYMSRNATGAILGPTFGVGEDALRLLSNIGKGQWSAADTHRIRKLLPLQNLFYLRWMFDQVEEGVNEAFGVPDRRQPFRRRNDY